MLMAPKREDNRGNSEIGEHVVTKGTSRPPVR